MLHCVDIATGSWAEAAHCNRCANCYCAKKFMGIVFSQVSGFKDVSFLGRAGVSSQAKADLERKRFPRDLLTP
jgi:hypothetical protein